MHRILISFIAISYFSAATAGESRGLIQFERIGKWNNTDIVFFYVAPHTNAPSCNNYNGRWALDIGTNLGRAQYSFLLSAESRNKAVYISGNGTCDLFSNSETASQVGY